MRCAPAWEAGTRCRSRRLLRSGTDEEIEAAIREGLSRKRDRHHMEEESFETMVRIGG